MNRPYELRAAPRRRRQAPRVRYRLRDPDVPTRRQGSPDRRGEGERETTDPRAPATVLVVDDDAQVRRILARMLQEEETFTVLEAANGIDALEKCARHPVSVVVTDVRMPGMDGFELSRRLAEAWPHVQVLFVTAYPDAEAANEYASRTLTKPFKPEELVAIVGSLVQRHWAELEGGGEDGD